MVRDCWLAVTGAEARLSIDGKDHDTGRSVFASRDSTVRVHLPTSGLRNYVAFDGGIVGNPVLGSMSTDTLSGIVAIAIDSGVTLRTGSSTGEPVFVDPVPQRRIAGVDILPGPRAAWCAAESMARMITEDWVVGTDVNRIGIRLDGPPMIRVVQGEVPSEGLVRGAVQLLPTGGLVVMLADHPVTGGYPVIAVVSDDGVDALAQCRPGERVRFRRSSAAWQNVSSVS
jgi:allophanate hydrolase subunit 2